MNLISLVIASLKCHLVLQNRNVTFYPLLIQAKTSIFSYSVYLFLEDFSLQNVLQGINAVLPLLGAVGKRAL